MWVPIEGKSFPEICNLCDTSFRKLCGVLTLHTCKLLVWKSGEHQKKQRSKAAGTTWQEFAVP